MGTLNSRNWNRKMELDNDSIIFSKLERENPLKFFNLKFLPFSFPNSKAGF